MRFMFGLVLSASGRDVVFALRFEPKLSVLILHLSFDVAPVSRYETSVALCCVYVARNRQVFPSVLSTLFVDAPEFVADTPDFFRMDPVLPVSSLRGKMVLSVSSFAVT